MLDIKEEKDGVTFRVKVQPRASKNELAGIIDGALKVRLTAPPVDGEANQACLKFFARLLGVPMRAVELVTGHTGRNKTLKIYGVTAGSVLQLLK